jgi:L-seryl-tRNA(Ser) seleniumtransferase
MEKPTGATESSAADHPNEALRGIPSIERILSGGEMAPLVERYGRPFVKDQVVSWLEALRGAKQPFDSGRCLVEVGEALSARFQSPLRRVINATGIIIHTNLGRSPIEAGLWSTCGEIACHYSNLEFDLEQGQRGARDEHLTRLASNLFGCEAAILTNNNASGTLLLLAAVAAGREVLVSRGELVEIGGAFRVPEVIQQGGAKLREVGTTNRTRAADYAEAASRRRTAAILRVQRSNFDIVGFTETPTVQELVEVSRSKKIPLLYDEGSGRVVDLSAYGFSRRQTLRELFEIGVDAVTCSTDKLIGASQGGLILGRREIVDRCRKHPLMRALRVGKESYAVVGETLRAFAAGRHEERIPIYRMLATSVEELRARAAALARGTAARVVETRAALGGGTTPTETIASVAVEVPGDADARAAEARNNEPPIVGRIDEDRFLLDLRTIPPEEDAVVSAALRRLVG